VAGKVISYVTYDSWGKLTAKAILKTGVRELDLVQSYTVHPYDQVLELFFAQARMYDPATLRWLSMDLLKGKIANPQSLNQYAYCSNNPATLIDLWGLTDVPARDYAEARDATVSWKGNYTTNGITYAKAEIHYNGVELDIIGRVENDKLMIDDKFLNNIFGWASTIIAGANIPLKNVPNNHIRPLSRGWEYRFELGDPDNPGDNPHMHVNKTDNSESYSQKDDGSPKDGPKGGTKPPKKILKELKEKTGWDWDALENDWTNKIDIITSGPFVYVTYPDGKKETIYIGYFGLMYPSRSDLINAYFHGYEGPYIPNNNSTFPILPNPGPVPIPVPQPMPMPIPAF
jgi:RHS repeat-associated protein